MYLSKINSKTCVFRYSFSILLKMKHKTDNAHKPGPPLSKAEATLVKAVSDKARRLVRENNLKKGKGYIPLTELSKLDDIYLI